MLYQTNYKYPSCKNVVVKKYLAHQLDFINYMQWLLAVVPNVCSNCYKHRYRTAVITECHKDLKPSLRCISHKNNVTVT